MKQVTLKDDHYFTESERLYIISQKNITHNSRHRNSFVLTKLKLLKGENDMNTNTVKELNNIIGRALIECANESYVRRISTMLSRPFDEVIESIKLYKKTRYNKANGYFADEAIRYFDSKLENEHEEVWVEIEDTCDNDWYEAVNKFYRW